MKYYKVKEIADQAILFRITTQGIRADGALLKDELYTPHEMEYIANGRELFEEVDIPENRVYWSFGARYELAE